MVTRLILVDIYIQVCFLNESGTSFGTLEVMHQGILSVGHLDSFLEDFCLSLQSKGIIHRTVPQEVSVVTHVIQKFTHESQECLSRLLLSSSIE